MASTPSPAPYFRSTSIWSGAIARTDPREEREGREGAEPPSARRGRAEPRRARETRASCAAERSATGGGGIARAARTGVRMREEHVFSLFCNLSKKY
jgi:hypothetical protein